MPLKDDYDVTFGKLSKIRYGNDFALLTTGSMLNYSITLLDELNEKEIDGSLFSVHTPEPFDKNELDGIRKNHSKIVVIEEHISESGLGSKVLNNLDYPLKLCQIGLSRTPLGSAPLNDLYKKAGIVKGGNILKILKYLGD